MFCYLSLPVEEATDGGLKYFVDVNVNASGLEGPAYWTSRTTKEVGCPLDCCCCLCLPPGSAEQVGWPGLKATVSLGWLRCIPLQLELVVVAVEMSVAKMLKLHLN